MEKNPFSIEDESFEIITRLLSQSGLLGRFDGKETAVVKRIVHATGDISVAESIVFSEGFYDAFCDAMRVSRTVVADVKMVSAGISRKVIKGLSVNVYVDDEDVIRKSVEMGVSRAYLAVDKALMRHPNAVFVIGNSPTALLRILEHGSAGFVIGVPVGFVGAPEVKQRLADSSIPHINSLGTRGGSPVAVAAFNALLLEAKADGVVC